MAVPGKRMNSARGSEIDQLWEQLAPIWIKEAREGRNAWRKGLLDRPMLEACGDVRGRRILNSGCGEGRFCRILRDAGAGYVLGVDLCAPLIDAARELATGSDLYLRGDVQDLSFLDDHSFSIWPYRT